MFDNNDELNPLAILQMTDEEKEQWLLNTFEDAYYEIQAMLSLWESTGIPLISASELPSLVKGLSLACHLYQKRCGKELTQKLH